MTALTTVASLLQPIRNEHSMPFMYLCLCGGRHVIVLEVFTTTSVQKLGTPTQRQTRSLLSNPQRKPLSIVASCSGRLCARGQRRRHFARSSTFCARRRCRPYTLTRLAQPDNDSGASAGSRRVCDAYGPSIGRETARDCAPLMPRGRGSISVLATAKATGRWSAEQAMTFANNENSATQG